MHATAAASTRPMTDVAAALVVIALLGLLDAAAPPMPCAAPVADDDLSTVDECKFADLFVDVSMYASASFRPRHW